MARNGAASGWRLPSGIALALLLAFLFSVTFQVPETTRFTVTFAPRVPSDVRPSELRVTSLPRYPLNVVPSGGIIWQLSWRPLFHYQLRRLAPVVTRPDGIEVAVTDPWLSAGAQQATEIALGINGPGERTSVIDFALDIDSPDAPRQEGVPACRDGVQQVRRRRSSPRTAGQPVNLAVAATLCRGGARTLAVDTSPLTFLVPDRSWTEAFDRVGPLAYSDPSDPARLRPSKMPLAGLDLPYTVEDELDGTPSPDPDQIQVSARVISPEAMSAAPSECRRWTTRLPKRCWRALTSQPADDCARSWPLRHDPKARVLHLDLIGRPATGCQLLLGVVAPAGDELHAMSFDLPPG